jgi:hypothetical protein
VFALPTTLGVFAMILVLARLRMPLGVAIGLGAATIGVAFSLHGGLTDPWALAGRVGGTLLGGCVAPKTVALVVITLLLMSLSSMMQAGGQFKEIVGLARALLRRPSVAMAALPALVGLLPMPGGALFSAPMVESAAGGNPVSGGVLSSINYWFRHIWEHWWPLYPGVLLAVSLTGVEWWRFAAFNGVSGLVMVAAGLLLFVGTHADLHAKSAPPPPGTKRRMLVAMSSILIVLVLWLPGTYIAAPWLVPFLPEAMREAVGKYAPLALGLIAALFWTARLRRMDAAAVRGCFSSGKIYGMAALVLAVMVFQHVIEAAEAAGRIAGELQKLHVPVVLIVAILPFIAGMVTGLAMGFVGTSFPIVLASVRELPEGGSVLPYVVLAYAFGHLGQMLSPLHVCHVMSNRYFKTGFGPVYRRILPPAGVCAAAAVGYFFLLKAVP